ncbi:MAG: PPC domain-containing protein [Myxococcales bacterium]
MRRLLAVLLVGLGAVSCNNEEPVRPDACTAETTSQFCSRMAAAGKVCGSITGKDICTQASKTVACGSTACTGATTCDASTNTCVATCTAETDAEFCTRLAGQGKVCGSITAADNCGDSKTVNCGTAACTGATPSCDAATNTCAATCTAETDAQFCTRLAGLGKVCGSITAANNCGAPKTVDCGSAACTGATPACDSATNTCVATCTAETDAQFCTRLAGQGKVCGSITASNNCGASKTIDCGTTACTGATPACDSVTNTCVASCTAETDAQFCTRLASQGKVCGSITAANNCGASKTVDCGTTACTGATPACDSATNTCVATCAAETDAQFCTRLASQGKVCGSITAANNCGASKTVDCGTTACTGATPACDSVTNTCVATCTAETDAQFCTRLAGLGKVCGSITAANNCGTSKTVNCGTTACTGATSCDTATNTCVATCTAETDAQFCTRLAGLGKVCGSITAANNCGTSKTIDCGTTACTGATPSCDSATNTCVATCTAETDAQFCTRLAGQGKVCGSITAANNCGTSKTVNCGTTACTGNTTCQSDNTCQCVRESDAAFCVAQHAAGKMCGSITANDQCGVQQTVDCGTALCLAGESCDSANHCVAPCTVESDAEFCVRLAGLGKNCGVITAANNCSTGNKTVDCGVASCDPTTQTCTANVCTDKCASGLAFCVDGCCAAGESCISSICIGGQTSPCQVASSFGRLSVSSPVEPINGGIAVTAALPATDTTTDLISLELYPGFGALSGGLAPGTYVIAGADTDYFTCGVCAMIYGDVTTSSIGSRYMATSGTVEITSVEGTLQAKLTNATFQHVTLTSTTQTPAADGCTSKVAEATFAGTNVPVPCDPLAPTACTGTEGCYYFGFDFRCLPAGHTPVGSACTQMGECVAGAECLSGTCLQLCSVTASPSTCQAPFTCVDVSGGQGLGACKNVPPNNLCANATALTFTNDTVTVTGTTAGAQNSYTATCGTANGADVTYSFTIPAGSNRQVTATVTPTSAGYVPAVSIQTVCGSTVAAENKACKVASSSSPVSAVAASLAPGTYYVVVDGAGGTEGPFSLTLSAMPVSVPDTCAAAQAIDLSPLAAAGYVGTLPLVYGDTTAAANDYGGSCRTQTNSARELVYAVTIPAGTTPRNLKVTMQFTSSASFRPYVYIRKDNCTSTAAADQVACAYSASGNPSVAVSVANAGPGTYYVFTDGYSSTHYGPFVMQVQMMDPASCLVPGSYGAVTPLDEYAQGSTTNGMYGEYALDSMGNALVLEFYPGSGVFTTAVAPGTYTLSGAELNYATCGLCVLVYDWFGRPHMATGGTVTLSSLAGNLTGSVSNLTFEQVTINATTFQSTPVAGGCQTAVGSMLFDTPITP